MSTTTTLQLGDWQLASGATAPSLRVACDISSATATGTAPWVLLLHGISGSHHALPGSGTTSDAGWAGGWAGPGRAVDTHRHHVLCPNLPGSCHGSTSGASLLEAAGAQWQHGWCDGRPLLSIADIAAAIARTAAALGIERFERVIGYSFGGYVALQMALAYPQLCGKTIVLASSWRGNGSPDSLPALADICRAAARDPTVTVDFRRDMLRNYGHDAQPASSPPQGDAAHSRTSTDTATAAAPNAATSTVDTAAKHWAREFDLRNLLILRGAAAAFDLSHSQPPAAPISVALADSDRVFPLQRTLDAIDSARRYGWQIETEVISTTSGHAAPVLEAGPWDALLRRWR